METRAGIGFPQKNTRAAGRIPVMAIKEALGINAADRIRQICVNGKTTQTAQELKAAAAQIAMKINITLDPEII